MYSKTKLKKEYREYQLNKHKTGVAILEQIAVMLIITLCVLLYEYAGILYPEYPVY